MRDPQQLRADPRFDFMVGKLVGATEMITHYMALHGDESAKGMAERVHSVLDFFLEDKEKHGLEKGGEELGWQDK